MTAARVIAFHFAPSAPSPCAEGTLLSASTVSVAIAELPLGLGAALPSAAHPSQHLAGYAGESRVRRPKATSRLLAMAIRCV
jgi:hypothetical protein